MQEVAYNVTLCRQIDQTQLDNLKAGAHEIIIQYPVACGHSAFDVMFEIAEYGSPSLVRHLFDRDDLEQRIASGLLYRACLATTCMRGTTMQCEFKNDSCDIISLLTQRFNDADGIFVIRTVVFQLHTRDTLIAVAEQHGPPFRRIKTSENAADSAFGCPSFDEVCISDSMSTLADESDDESVDCPFPDRGNSAVDGHYNEPTGLQVSEKVCRSEALTVAALSRLSFFQRKIARDSFFKARNHRCDDLAEGHFLEAAAALILMNGRT